MKIDDHPIHAAAGLFPHMAPGEFELLKADIRENGLEFPIVLWRGEVIDGRHRYRACKQLGIEANFVEFPGEEEEIGPFVVSCNLHRRHLTASQSAMIAAKLAARKPGDNRPSAMPSQADAAKALGVGERSVRRAARVLNSGTSELAEAVKQGDVTLADAEQVAELSPASQREAIGKVATGHATKVAKAAKEAAPDSGSAEDEWLANLQRPFKEAGNALNKILREFGEIAGDATRGGHILWTRLHVDLENSKSTIASAMPYKICPACNAKKSDKCETCKRTGYLTKVLAKALSAEEAAA